jgi:hypothetical protein
MGDKTSTLLSNRHQLFTFRMSSHPYKRARRRKRSVLLEDDVDAAEVVTFKNVTVTTKSGEKKTRRVKVALFEPAKSAQMPQAMEKRSLLSFNLAKNFPLTPMTPGKLRTSMNCYTKFLGWRHKGRCGTAEPRS